MKPAARFLALLVACSAIQPAVLAAQEALLSCPIEQCELRVERRVLLNSLRVVRGHPGEVVRFGAPLDSLLAGSDSAMAWVREYQRHQSAHWTLSVLGMASLGGVALAPWSDRPSELGPRLVILTIGLGIASRFTFASAEKALRRATWWHNQRLRPPEPVERPPAAAAADAADAVPDPATAAARPATTGRSPPP